MSRKTLLLWAIALLALLALAGCATPTTIPAAQDTSATQDTSAVQPTAETAQTEPTTAPESPSTEPTTVPETVDTGIVKLNLNTATGDEFQALIPDFSNRMVREFLEYRPYISILQFRQEIGKYVDDAQIAEYEKYVFVPVDVDESDAETLKQLPRVDDTIAAALMDARPYGSNDAFLAKLAEYISESDLATAVTYLAP
ncbi:MAG TPA: hypothetical protein PK530_23125 [Anaerolineales bacterium]|nr:hypothetical protein [Anaerolineales bacterium]